jgi:biotin carboxylase
VQDSMNNKPVAIVLGGTVPHKFLIENLQERGYFTILVDYFKNPPAADSADKHICESTLDKEIVLSIAREEKASLVISGCVDQANVTACYVAEKLGLPAPYGYETAIRVSDKSLMKKGMVKAGVPTAVYEVVTKDKINSFQVGKYPKVVKPCDCNGSKGVRKVNCHEELKHALTDACKLSRTEKAIVEDFNSGMEVSGYFYIGKEDITLIYIKRKSLPENFGSKSLQSFLSVGPEEIHPRAKEAFINAVRKISKEFGLINTPILAQANIDGADVKIIEFAPRVGGGLAFREIKLLTGFDLIDAVISSYEGNKVNTKIANTNDGMISVVHLYGEDGFLDHIDGMDDLIVDGTVEAFHMHKTPGMKMSSADFSSHNRVLGVIIRFKSEKDLEKKINLMLNRLSIVNTDGHDVLVRNVFLKSPGSP